MATEICEHASKNKVGHDGQTQKYQIRTQDESTVQLSEFELTELAKIQRGGIGTEDKPASGCVAAYLCLPTPTLMYYWAEKFKLQAT